MRNGLIPIYDKRDRKTSTNIFTWSKHEKRQEISANSTTTVNPRFYQAKEITQRNASRRNKVGIQA